VLKIHIRSSRLCGLRGRGVFGEQNFNVAQNDEACNGTHEFRLLSRISFIKWIVLENIAAVCYVMVVNLLNVDNEGSMSHIRQLSPNGQSHCDYLITSRRPILFSYIVTGICDARGGVA